jgi:3-hydroxyisobutyryl-CoA hydrolase
MGRHMTIPQVLSMEFDLVTCLVGKHVENFRIGVTHRLINRKRDRPEWVPATFADVSDELIDSFFVNADGPWLFEKSRS